MKLPEIELSSQGKPCGSARIYLIEAKIGRELPRDYRQFIKKTGGGYLGLKNIVVDGLAQHLDQKASGCIKHIFGTRHERDDENSLAGHGAFWTEEWGIPNEVLLFGRGNNRREESYVLNYDLKEFPRHAVLYRDVSLPGQFIQVAPSFAEFLAHLRPSPDYTEEMSDFIGRMGLYCARRAPLGSTLLKAIDASPYADMESVLRNAAEGIAVEDRMDMYGGEESFRFQDLLFALAAPLSNHDSLESWTASRGADPHSVNIADLLDGIFRRPGTDWSSLNYTQAAMDMWWTSRTELGVLVATPQGFKLKDDYVEWVISTFR